MEFERGDLEQYGFRGFSKVSHVKSMGCEEIPERKGVYVVVRQNSHSSPDFLAKSIGGHFKGEDPTVARDELKENWVENAYVLYIGKAGGSTLKATLFSRIKQYIDFGKGKNVGHKGGRFIWQLTDSDDLMIAWRPLTTEEPSDVETELISEFRQKYGNRPFANLVK